MLDSHFIEAPVDASTRNTQMAAAIALLAIVLSLASYSSKLAEIELNVMGDPFSLLDGYVLWIAALAAAAWCYVASTIVHEVRARSLLRGGAFFVFVALSMPFMVVALLAFGLLELFFFPQFFKADWPRILLSIVAALGLLLVGIWGQHRFDGREAAKRFRHLRAVAVEDLSEGYRRLELGLPRGAGFCFKRALMAAYALQGERDGVVYPRLDSDKIFEQLDQSGRSESVTVAAWLRGHVDSDADEADAIDKVEVIGGIIAGLVDEMVFEQVAPPDPSASLRGG